MDIFQSTKQVLLSQQIIYIVIYIELDLLCNVIYIELDVLLYYIVLFPPFNPVPMLADPLSTDDIPIQNHKTGPRQPTYDQWAPSAAEYAPRCS